MKNIKRIIALALAALMLTVFAGCHGKDEVAATAGDTTFTSAFYMCALINADMEARTKVDQAKAEAQKDKETTSSATSSAVEETDYFAEKIEDKTFSQWIKDTAINSLKRFAFLDAKIKELKIEIKEEEIANYEYYAEYYWTNYGYQSLFEPNGVALSTYKKYMAYTAYEDAYFDYIYGEGGQKEISKADMTKFMGENYVIADVLQGSTAELKEEAKITEYKNTFAGYAKRLEQGEDFKKVYNEFNNVKEDSTSSAASTTSGEKEEAKPKDELAQVIGKEGTSYESEYYEDVKAMKNGEVKQYSPEGDANTLLIFKKGDIMADPYYIDELADTIRYDMKFKEFDKELDTACAAQALETVSYAINRFKVEKIKYPEA